MDLAEQALETLDEVAVALPGGGERREGQRRMVTAVATAIRDGGHVVVQAGTGTGKSLAYLVPTALAGKTTIVATATKALQDQLAGKDLPFLDERIPGGVDFAVLKGRSNYLCLQRLDEAEADDRLGLDLGDQDTATPTLDSDLLARLRVFAAATETGDRAELPDIDDRAWRLVSVGRDECPGAGRCPVGDDCLAERARRKAATADVIIVNLHLYAIEIMVEGILPEHDLVVIDEAHQLEDIVSEAAGRQISPARLRAAARSAGAVLAARDAPEGVEDAATLLHSQLEHLVGQRLADGLDDDTGATIDLIRGRVDQLLNALRVVPKDAPAETAAKALRARQAVTSLLDDIDYVRWPIDHEVLWVDGPTSNPSLRSTPISIDKLLEERLWSKRPGILTSATLSPATVTLLGLPAGTEMLDVGSPFDYEKNALLYCPTNLPDPRAEGHREARLAELEALIVAAGGRTLALFTSWAAMREAAAHLEPRLPWPVLVQGEGSKMALLASFVEDDESCLFATMSFWQGVDIPGSTCNLVVIDRLPFPRPDDPVLQARRERAGKAAFRTIDLPRAATMLAQGAGRLIRSATDRGVVAVLDPRLATSRSYRWELINALPPMRRTKERSEAEALLRELRDE
ncbi:MAG: ATP-dependent DNA helicase [Acidimicrobiales bacterium]